jgi:hypothetical protein
LAAVIESKFGFFEMDIEFIFRDSLEFLEPMFGKAPKTFNAIDVGSTAVRKLVSVVIDPKMFLVSEVNQAVVTTPTIRMDD